MFLKKWAPIEYYGYDDVYEKVIHIKIYRAYGFACSARIQVVDMGCRLESNRQGPLDELTESSQPS